MNARITNIGTLELLQMLFVADFKVYSIGLGKRSVCDMA